MACDGAGGTGGLGAAFRWIRDLWLWWFKGQPENLGIKYYVDGTNGLDAYNGRSWQCPFKTIQKAITEQIANTTSLGDVIYIAPGNYAESLTGDLTRVSIIGVKGDYPWHIVSVRPTDGYAYYGTLFEALIKNICFLSSDDTNKDYPAVQLVNARYSVIEDCHFVGRDPTCVEGLQIGNRDAVATVANFDYCIVRNCRFDTWYGTASQFTFGIKLGRVGYDAGCSVKYMVGTSIEDCFIYAKEYGIYIGVYTADFSVIQRNAIDSLEHEKGCATRGVEFYGGWPMVLNNRINAIDAILVTATGLVPQRVLGNWVANNGVMATENPALT